MKHEVRIAAAFIATLTEAPVRDLFFGCGRTIGWIAHAIEQYESGALIRPRARYSGQPVVSQGNSQSR